MYWNFIGSKKYVGGWGNQKLPYGIKGWEGGLVDRQMSDLWPLMEQNGTFS